MINKNVNQQMLYIQQCDTSCICFTRSSNMIPLNGLVVLFFQILSLQHVNSDVFSSVYKLKLLATKEGRLLEIFKEYKESICSGNNIMSAPLNR